MRAMWQDIRFGARMLAKHPGFTMIAVLTLALGIGANTAIFSLVSQVLLRRLPVQNPSELVILRSPGPTTGHVWSDGDEAQSFSYPMYKGLRDTNSVFSGMLARFAFPATIAEHGQTERGSGELVSGNYFDVLGLRPVLGRLFMADDDRIPSAQPIVVLSYAYWTHRFGGNPDVLNQSLLVNNTELTVVGVAQAGFTGIQVGQSADIFVPLMMKAQMTPERNGLEEWNNYWLAVLARRKPGLSMSQTEAGINAAYRPLLQEQLAKINDWGKEKRQRFTDKKILLISGAKGRTTLQSDSGQALTALFVMVALVLLIACTNVANLLLAQGAARQRELGIRSAMGASRGRMVRQLLAESLLCALAGGALGLLIGVWLMNLLTPIVAANLSIKGLSTSLDPGILSFAAGATIVSGIFFGLIPAWRVTRTAVAQTLKDQATTTSAGTSHVGARKMLVAGQVAFTLLLLAGAFLFTRTLSNLRKQNLGLRTENVVTFAISPILNGYDTPRSIALLDQLRARMAAIPGVRAVGTSELGTLTGSDMGSNITIEGSKDLSSEDSHVNFDPVSPGYFSTLGVPLLAGREFNEGDGPGKPKVAVISEAMAKKYFVGRNPMGLHFAFGSGKVQPDIEIVGVVKDVKQSHVRDADVPYIYLPYAQRPTIREMTFYTYTQQDPLLAVSALRSTVRELDANLPIFDIKTMERVVDQDLFGERIVAALSATFGTLAALLAAMGIYGVLAYLVVQRTREIGIRMALGAETSHVRFLIVKEVGSMVLLGVAIGLPLAYGLARFSESLLFGVHAGDPAVYALGLALIAVIALAACYIPARRATRVDPLVALRYE
ncbi:MAG TPA: ABC transporter permease [Candidatus Acidoferrum sp.]|nr:ABC transporter permease [Candidatus Acidoferrum sp.]